MLLCRVVSGRRQGVQKGGWGPKTSNKVLVYATREQPKKEEHLLLFILFEQEAPETSQMKTHEAKKLMAQPTSCAADFMDESCAAAWSSIDHSKLMVSQR